MIIDGKKIAEDILIDLQARVRKLSFTPVLCDIVVGDDPVSLSFVRIKQKKAESIGVGFKMVQLDGSSPEEEIITTMEEVQTDPNLCGLIVQLPLPYHLDSNKVLATIHERVDVDGISPVGATYFYNNTGALVPPTAGAIAHILDSLSIDLSKEKFLVMGQGELVGKPITHILQKRGYWVMTADAHTDNVHELLQQATVLITGVGKQGVVTGDMVQEGVVVIDAGTSESGGSIKGDVDIDSVAPKARYITPVPGGVGPVTVAKLLENVIVAAENRANT